MCRSDCPRRFVRLLLSVLGLATICQVGTARAQEFETFATASDGTPLQWQVFQPEGNGPWPAVLIIHGGGFKGGGPIDSGAICGPDLAAAGFIAFSIEYRLAPDGHLPGQTSDGRFPDQTDDVKLAVLAARADPRCNGQVGSVGGSAGGSHTAFVAGTGVIGHGRIDVGVCLSGSYDFTDFRTDPNIAAFIDNVTNYVGVPASDTVALRAASPGYLIDGETAPLLLIHSEQDSMPFSQLGDMTAQLDRQGITNYQTIILPGDLHAFDYWSTIKEQAIAFLNAGFAGTLPAIVPTKMLLNVSSRTEVASDAHVMIGGFIITGDVAKRVALRAIGPSLADVGVINALADPTLALYDSSGALIAENDNCSSLPPGAIPFDLQPPDSRESFIAATLEPGSYTAVLQGADNGSGVALFELYDLASAHGRVSNISTRGAVGTGGDVMIGGFIIGGNDPTEVLVRAIGPSLANNGIGNTLPDPVLELHDANRALLVLNNNWRDDQEQQILGTGLAPKNNLEGAVLTTLEPGDYTAIVRDAVGRSGIALIDVYDLESE